MLLDTTSKSLVAEIDVTVTTSNLQVTVDFADHTTTTFIPGNEYEELSTGAAEVEITSPPVAATERQIKRISVFNKDTVISSVTISLKVSSTNYQIVKVALDSNDTLQYDDHTGWKVTTANGSTKTANVTVDDPHYFGGSKHIADSIANVNSKLADGTLITSLPAEINALTEKTTVYPNDEFLIEDADATNVKKKAKYSNIASKYWIDAVIGFFDPTSSLPGSPTEGDRYIASATANGWVKDNVYQYHGSSWLSFTPVEGSIVAFV
jgi:hypothetical protein